MTYIIQTAGHLDSTLAACRVPVRETAYPSRRAAMRDLAMVIPGDTDAILADMVAVDGSDGWYVYTSQGDADGDGDGSHAIAVIARA